jgi:ribonuclease HI
VADVVPICSEGPTSKFSPDLVVFCDGGCTANPGRLAVAAVACTPEGELLVESARWAGEGTSNLAEYRALSHAVCIARLLGSRCPLLVSDSMLVVQQVNAYWATNGDPGAPLVKAHSRCSTALMRFDRWALKHVRREHNRRADWLVSGLIGHDRTLKNPPAVQPVFFDGEGRPGWSQLSDGGGKKPRSSARAAGAA